VIGPGEWSHAPPDLSFFFRRKTYVAIGNENVIREHCTIHRGSAEDSVTRSVTKFSHGREHVGHNCEIGNNVIIAIIGLLGGHVSVATARFSGGACVFHQHMCVGPTHDHAGLRHLAKTFRHHKSRRNEIPSSG